MNTEEYRLKSFKNIYLCVFCATGIIVAHRAPAHAQNYPSRPIRIVVPYPPGGGTDMVARTLAQKMTEVMGSTVLVDNRPGANGIIGSDVVAKAAPDGYKLFKNMAGIDVMHVPYKGAGQAMSDLLSGQVPIFLNNFLAGAQMIKAGRLRALAVTSGKRSSAAPEVPTVAESGVPGYVVTGWYGMLAPAATPVPVLRVLHEGAVKALKSREVSGRLSNEAAEIVASTPREFAVFLKTESEKWTAVIRKSKVKLAE